MGCCPSKSSKNSGESTSPKCWRALGKYIGIGCAGLAGLLGCFGIWILWCFGFGTCWGKKYIKKVARKYDISVDHEQGQDMKMKDGFVLVEAE